MSLAAAPEPEREPRDADELLREVEDWASRLTLLSEEMRREVARRAASSEP